MVPVFPPPPEKPLTDTVVDALLIAPPIVVQSSWNVAEVEIGDVAAVPLTLVLEELRALKSGCCLDEMVQLCMPPVDHPICEVPPAGIIFGLATRIIVGCVICTLHCAPEVTVPLEHVSA